MPRLLHNGELSDDIDEVPATLLARESNETVLQLYRDVLVDEVERVTGMVKTYGGAFDRKWLDLASKKLATCDQSLQVVSFLARDEIDDFLTPDEDDVDDFLSDAATDLEEKGIDSWLSS